MIQELEHAHDIDRVYANSPHDDESVASPKRDAPMTRKKRRLLLGALVLAVIAPLLMLTFPRFGFTSAFGSIGVAAASAVVTLIARR